MAQLKIVAALIPFFFACLLAKRVRMTYSNNTFTCTWSLVLPNTIVTIDVNYRVADNIYIYIHAYLIIHYVSLCAKYIYSLYPEIHGLMQ